MSGEKTICLKKGLKEFIYELRKCCCCCFCLEMPNKLKKVYELEGLVCDLHAHFTAASGSTLAISKSKATELLASTIFDYEPNSRYFWTCIDFVDRYPRGNLETWKFGV